MKKHSINQSKGIGLLELLLAFTVITVLLITAARYYRGAQAAREVQTAVSSIQAVYFAGAQYFEDGQKFTADDQIPIFISKGLLPASFNPNPWGTSSAAKTTSSETQLALTLNSVPQQACRNLSSKISDNPSFVDPSAKVSSCDSDPVTVTITFTNYVNIQ